MQKRYSVTASTKNKSRTIYKAEGGVFGEKAPKSRQRGGKDGCRKYATKMKKDEEPELPQVCDKNEKGRGTRDAANMRQK